MEHYLVDTNVVIDMLLDREDADAACAVFEMRDIKVFQLSELKVIDSVSFLPKASI